MKVSPKSEAAGIDYDSGDIDADQFVGREITVRVGVEKKRGFAGLTTWIAASFSQTPGIGVAERPEILWDFWSVCLNAPGDVT